MKTLHLYLTRQVSITLLMTVAVFTFVLLLGNVMKEVLALLVSRQITLVLVGKAIVLLVPYVMAFVLPFGMLTAVLLVFGRFSADNELTAVRAGGASLLALITPVLLLSLGLCVLCAWFNLSVAPQCRHAYKNLIFQLGARTISSLVTEDRFITEIPGMILFIRKKAGNELEDIRLYTLQTNEITSRLSAAKGRILYDAEEQTIQFELANVFLEHRYERSAEENESFIGPPAPERPPEWQIGQMGLYTTDPRDLGALMRDERKPKLSEMSLRELLDEKRALESRGVSAMPVRVQLHRQLSFSFACFAFTLIGIPLAIQAHRRETSIGIAISLGLVLLYYMFFILGDALESTEQFYPHIIVWLPNAIFQALGGILLFRANRR